MIKQNKSIVVGGCVAVLAISFLLIISNTGTGLAGSEAPRWAYDLNTGTLVYALGDQPSPFDTGSGQFDYPEFGTGGAGVDAYIYTCGNASDVREGMSIEDLEEIDARLLFVGHLSRKSHQAKLHKESGSASSSGIDSFTDVGFIGDIEGKTWVPDMSGPAFEMRKQALLKLCEDGSKPRIVAPD